MMLLQAPPPPLPPEVFMPPWMVMPPQAIVLIVMAVCAAAALVLFPIMRALARRLEGRGGDPALRGELEELRERVGEVDLLQQRVAELEERLDFTERLLTQVSREPHRLGGEAR